MRERVIIVDATAAAATAAVMAAAMGGLTEARKYHPPELIMMGDREPDPAQPADPYGWRVAKRRDTRGYSGHRYKGSRFAKRATKRGGNPARQG